MRRRWGRSSVPDSVQAKAIRNSDTSSVKPCHSGARSHTSKPAKKVENRPKLDLQLEDRVSSDLSVSQERSYAESYLPLTIKSAEQSRTLIEQETSEFPKGWPFQDKVLVWLAPIFRDDVRHFHRNNGPSIDGLFEEHQLNHLDRDLAKQLSERLKNLPSDRRTA